MSNSSDRDRVDNLDGATFADGVSRLLSAIADEILRAATEVVALGEKLSGDAASRADRTSYDLQVFDAFSQTAHAQARLLKRLAVREHGQQMAHLGALIDEVPFAHVRQRLESAAYGRVLQKPSKEESSDSEVSWF
jgi:hypothetical protein